MKLQTSGFFSAAHFLTNYKGKCQNCHGHLYAYWIEIISQDEDLTKSNGMIIDFGFIKKMFDHKLVYNKAILFDTNYSRIKQLIKQMECYGIDGNPTAENMAKEIVREIKNNLIGTQKSIIVRIWEDVESLIDASKLKSGEGEYIEVNNRD